MQTPTSTNMINENPILSIIVPTIGRIKELDELLLSLSNCKISVGYEILIVDQNKDIILDDILAKYTALPLKHHKVNFSGLSKAKNYGVTLASGDYVSFPDDDCKIFENTYNLAFEILEKNNADMVFGKCIDEQGKDSVLNFRKDEYTLNKDNMVGGFVEATVVCKKSIFEAFQYDENMGAGTFFGSGEGFDWMYRILTQSTFKAYYSPEILFYHPQVILEKGNLASLNRTFKYSCGTGYLCRKHNFLKKYHKRLILVKLANFGFYFFNKEKYNYYSAELYGLKTGYLFSKYY